MENVVARCQGRAVAGGTQGLAAVSRHVVGQPAVRPMANPLGFWGGAFGQAGA